MSKTTTKDIKVNKTTKIDMTTHLPYDARKVVELKAMAKERGIPGTSKMSKALLVHALEHDDAATGFAGEDAEASVTTKPLGKQKAKKAPAKAKAKATEVEGWGGRGSRRNVPLSNGQVVDILRDKSDLPKFRYGVFADGAFVIGMRCDEVKGSNAWHTDDGRYIVGNMTAATEEVMASIA